MYSPVSAEDAVKIIKSNDRVWVQMGAAAPQFLVKAMTARHEELKNVEVCHLHVEGEAPYSDPKYRDSFYVNAFFISGNFRQAINNGNGSLTPVFFSEVPRLFTDRVLDIDVALIHVSTPDKHGYCSLGVTVGEALAAIENAKHVIAQVNPQMPRTHGSGVIHVSEIDTIVDVNDEIPLHHVSIPSEIDQKIGDHVAGMIEDGSTLQMGIGNIPNAVLTRLHNHKNLGLHTEMFSDGVIDLFNEGVINNKCKALNKGRSVVTFLMGSRALYDFVDDNPSIEVREVDYVNDVSIIRQNPKTIAINTAIEIDVTGQACADSIGPRLYSGVGGQVDFIRGSTLSEGGKAILAMPSTSSKGYSKIVPFLKHGAGVVTTRNHIRYVVTEYGIADLFGKNIAQRIKALAEIAHPKFSEQIMKDYHDKNFNGTYVL